MWSLSFDVWKREVNKRVVAICGLTCDDLPDVDYRGWYDSEVPPGEAALDVLREADFPFDDKEWEDEE